MGNKKNDATYYTAKTPGVNPATITKRGTDPEERGKNIKPLGNPSLGHQIFVRVPDAWSERGRKPAYMQTMPTPTSLDTLKERLSQLLSIPTHAFCI